MDITCGGQISSSVDIIIGDEENIVVFYLGYADELASGSAQQRKEW
ncbi:hypothetical protein [Lacicoccus qingdaonensis]|nr:hypothetical protein [Salinicoccus qingdaonensis]